MRCDALRRLPLVALAGLLVGFAAETARAEGDLLANGSFAAWEDGAPVGWTASTGAHHGGGDAAAPASRLEPLEDGGVASVGDARVRRWLLWSRPFEATPGGCYRVGFEARGVGLEREGAQFDNCWVGALFEDARGKRVGFQYADARAATWRRDFLYVHAPPGTAVARAAFFCSLSGRFELRRMSVRRMPPEAGLEVLAEDVGRRYSFLAPHGIDWPALVARHRRAVEGAATPAAFGRALVPLLAELRDGHVWIDVPGQARVQPWSPRVTPNLELPRVLARLKPWRQVLRNVIAGRTAGGFGYLAVGSLQGTPRDLERLDAAWRELFDAPGIVLDLRVNGGGQEAWGQHLLGCLTDAPILYGRSLGRSGPRPGDLARGADRYLQPRKGLRYRGPVVALVGPGCVSSGEGMAMMCRALPDVTLVGLPTRGSSGNPQPLALPNGVTVWYSRWISLLPDGTPLERKGVPPDVRVEHAQGEDPAFEKALQLLAARRAR